jgi:glutamate synthase domain-containing protein 2
VKKILSKMGISLLSSYTGAQIFEIYGLGKEVVDIAFKGSISRIGGLSLDEIATEVIRPNPTRPMLPDAAPHTFRSWICCVSCTM